MNFNSIRCIHGPARWFAEFFVSVSVALLFSYLILQLRW